VVQCLTAREAATRIWTVGVDEAAAVRILAADLLAARNIFVADVGKISHLTLRFVIAATVRPLLIRNSLVKY
jgi:hypothetical protein